MRPDSETRSQYTVRLSEDLVRGLVPHAGARLLFQVPTHSVMDANYLDGLPMSVGVPVLEQLVTPLATSRNGAVPRRDPPPSKSSGRSRDRRSQVIRSGRA